MKKNPSVLAVALLLGASVAPLAPWQLAGFAAAVSVVGGIASAMRRAEGQMASLVMYGLNMGVLGGSTALMAYGWVENSATRCWTVIGAVGLLSLGGMQSIDFVLGLLKSRIKQEVKNEQPPSQG